MFYTKIDFKIKEKKPYPFTGATLRGALGYALKKLEKNPKHQNSLFNQMFIKEYDIPLYRIALDMESENFSFSIYLFNSLANRAREIVLGFKYAIEVAGLGKERIAYTIENIIVNNKEYDTEAKPLVLDPKYSDKSCDIELFFQTPLRVYHNGKIVKKALNLETILSSTYRKMCALFNEEMRPLPYSPKYTLENRFLSFEYVERTSTRQKQKISLGGLLGVMSFSNVDPQSVSLLEVAEVLGIGKNNTVGLGSIKVEKKGDSLRYYFAAKIKSIQEYIFKTDKLKEIIGASALVDKFGEELSKEVDSNLIQISAGSFKVTVSNKEALEDFLFTFEKRVQKKYPNVDLVYGFIGFEGDLTEEINQQLEDKLKKKENQIEKPFISLPSVIKRNPRTGMGVYKEKLDYETYKKTQESKKTNKFEKLFNSKFVKDFEDLKNSKSLIAVIHADGNNMRRIIPKMFAQSENYEEEFKEFSQMLTKTTEDAAVKAYEESFYDSDKFRPLIIAGDDLTVVCSADYALEFTHLFLKYFEEESAKNLQKFLQRAKVNSLTACAGIAYTKQNFPIHYSLKLAEDLCRYTKDTLKQEGDLIPSALSFHFVQSSYLESFDATKEKELTLNGLGLLYAPYYLKNKAPYLEDLLDSIEKIQKQNKIKTAFREWQNIYGDSIENAEHFLKRRYEILKDEFEDLEQHFEDLGITFTNPINNNKTPIADIVKLASLSDVKTYAKKEGEPHE